MIEKIKCPSRLCCKTKNCEHYVRDTVLEKDACRMHRGGTLLWVKAAFENLGSLVLHLLGRKELERPWTIPGCVQTAPWRRFAPQPLDAAQPDRQMALGCRSTRPRESAGRPLSGGAWNSSDGALGPRGAGLGVGALQLAKSTQNALPSQANTRRPEL